ncbi:MAG: SAM-dependent methyltransferase [Acidobacteria bacterium]|nr:MAG: SAM-dependent methyltransferase [Acidobacteriota bacterium]
MTLASSSGNRGRTRAVPPVGRTPDPNTHLARFDPATSRVIVDIEERRRRTGEALDPARRAELGQFFTPSEVAAFMADMFEVTDRPARLLDPGAGVGSLTAAVTARWQRERGGPLAVTAVEADPLLHEPLGRTIAELGKVHQVNGAVVEGDFIEWAAGHVSGFGALEAPKFDLVVMNPPYRKIHTASHERRTLAAAGIEVPNLYAGFVALAAELLDDQGQLVAIIPRSFTNGPYFRRFRRLLLDRIGLQQIHVLDSRDVAFADSAVLQENVVIRGVRGERSAAVVVSSSRSAAEPVTTREVPYSEVVRPDDPETFIHITLDEASAEFARQVLELPCRLATLDLSVSTGPVVDFRAKEHLRQTPGEDTVPLIFPAHLRKGSVVWPQTEGKKPNALVRCEATERSLMPSGTYVLVKRFSSKEERRRITATVVSASDLPGDTFAFENHLNVFHRAGQGLPDRLAAGLAAFLNTTTVDQFFRQFNGHTQVNATDLRNLQYPTIEELEMLGILAGDCQDQRTLDAMAAEVLSTFVETAVAQSA